MGVIIAYYVTLVLWIGIPSIVALVIYKDTWLAWIGLWMTTALLSFGMIWVLLDKELRRELKMTFSKTP